MANQLSKVLIFLANEKDKIKKSKKSLRFSNYYFSAIATTDKQWVHVNLQEFGKAVNIKFYVSILQVRFSLNGVELSITDTEPFKEEIRNLYLYFLDEWKKRQLEAIKNQFE